MTEAVFFAPLLAATLSAVGILLLRRTTLPLPPDIPNDRSLHVAPVPRAGGYAIWLGFLPAALVYAPDVPGGLAAWLPAWLALAVVSGLDDRGEVGVVPRLTVHALASLWTAAWLVVPMH